MLIFATRKIYLLARLLASFEHELPFAGARK
jgi:hypothetical protein